MILARVGTYVSPWAWHAHPEVWAIMASAVVLFFLAVRRIGPSRVPEGELVISRRQLLYFASGVAFLWVFADWPVHDLSERYLYSVHMAQHMVFILIAPPLLILGTPQWLQRWILQPRPLQFVAQKLCRPIVAAVVFNVSIAVSHAPAWVNFTLEHDNVHFLAHLFIFLAAMIMWFPVVNSMPEYPRMGHAVKLCYLFVQSILPNVPVAFLAFSTGVVYKFYATVPRPFPISAVEDQQVAAAIMKVGGTFIIWSIMVGVFFTWYREEHGPMSAAPKRTPVMPEVLTWDDVERELAKAEPAHPTA